MSERHSLPARPPLAADEIRQIDALCDAYEKQWKQGGRPQIDDYLQKADLRLREHLLYELVAMDAEYRARQGEQVNLEDYQQRFSAYSGQLRSAWISICAHCPDMWERLVAHFEVAARQGVAPCIEDYIANADDAHGQLLKALVRMELQVRLQSGEPARVEEYLQRFPRLAEDERFVVSLIREEHRLRVCRKGELVDEEYLVRFPQYRAHLAPSEDGRNRADHHLLFGLLALQNGFVTREELVAATSAWLLDKTKQLGEILLDRDALTADEFQLLTALVSKHLQKHEDNVEKSLAALSSIGEIRVELNSLGDDDVQQTLARVSVSRRYDVDRLGAVGMPSRAVTAGNRFRVLRPHARGGMGQVSVAFDAELNRKVALKEILPPHAGRADIRSRFVLEAEITGGLEHPGIVPVYSLGQYADGRPFYVMRFIKGDSLEEAIKRFHAADQAKRDSGERSLKLRKLLSRFIDVCQAVEYAHSRGVLHRDLKPGNIVLGKYGETLVVDWGLAKPLGHREADRPRDEQTLQPRSGGRSAPTQAGSAIGTPAFMPPEQAAGRVDQLGPASDVYSLGATLYYLLTGQAPFQDTDLGRLLSKVQVGDFPRPHSVRRNIPAALEAICLQAMAREYERRYGTPADLAEDIEHWLADEPVAACREPLTARVGRALRKHPTLVTALAATLFVGLLGTVVITAVVSGKNQQLAAANADLLAANQKEQKAKEEADRRRQESEAVLDFFRDKVLAATRPKDQEGGLGINTTIRAAIDAAEPQIADAFADQPLVEAARVTHRRADRHGDRVRVPPDDGLA